MYLGNWGCFGAFEDQVVCQDIEKARLETMEESCQEGNSGKFGDKEPLKYFN